MISQDTLGDLDRVKSQLSLEEQSVEELWQSRPLLWQSLGWSQAQLKLWLRCLSGITESGNGQGVKYGLPSQNNAGPDLGVEIAQIVKAQGKPLPLAQIKSRLPSGLIATEEMIKAAIDKHPNLLMQGPLVRAK